MGEDNFSFYNHQRRDKKSGNPINRRNVIRMNGKKSQRAKPGDDAPFGLIFINRFNEKNKSQQNQGERRGVKRIMVNSQKNVKFRQPKIHWPMNVSAGCRVRRNERRYKNP